MIRVGIGYDLHRLVPTRRLILGGVDVPYDKGLLGHSDADVLVHAICDALLGAASMGDIGRHFPDNDPAYKDIDSLKLLAQTVALVKEAGFSVGNLDATLMAQAPKLVPYIPQMETTLAETIAIPVECINIKATTTEKMGVIGRNEAMAAMCVALIEPT